MTMLRIAIEKKKKYITVMVVKMLNYHENNVRILNGHKNVYILFN